MPTIEMPILGMFKVILLDFLTSTFWLTKKMDCFLVRPDPRDPDNPIWDFDLLNAVRLVEFRNLLYFSDKILA